MWVVRSEPMWLLATHARWTLSSPASTGKPSCLSMGETETTLEESWEICQWRDHHMQPVVYLPSSRAKSHGYIRSVWITQVVSQYSFFSLWVMQVLWYLCAHATINMNNANCQCMHIRAEHKIWIEQCGLLYERNLRVDTAKWLLLGNMPSKWFPK